jgi:hypothetical protein
MERAAAYSVAVAGRAGGDPAGARLLGAAVLGLAALATAAQLRKAMRRPPAGAAALPQGACALADPGQGAARALDASAALLGASVLLDSAVEHYRASFENPGMLTPLLSSLMTVLAGAASAAGRPRSAHGGIYATALASGAAGAGFHLYNVMRRPGRFNWLNLFYAAPLGAPAALSLAGLFGLAAQRLRNSAAAAAPRLAGLSAGRLLSALTSIGLAGTSAEAGLLHFRGAFQNPFMWLPVSVPPVAALLMAGAAARPAGRKRRFTRAWLGLTGALGIAGMGFHAYGVSRQMGGWRNTRQNLLSGPPLSAPPSFSALALAGYAALALLGSESAPGQGAKA